MTILLKLVLFPGNYPWICHDQSPWPAISHVPPHCAAVGRPIVVFSRSDAQPGLYLFRCNYQAQEQELLAQLQGNLKLRWHQVFSQFTAAYYSDQALADLEEKAIAQGLLCLWLEPQADDLGAILNLLETTLTNLGIQPSHINGAMVFGLTPAVNLTAATFQSQIALWIVTLPTADYQERQVSDGLATATDLGEITWPSQALQYFWQRTEQDYFQKLTASGP